MDARWRRKPGRLEQLAATKYYSMLQISHSKFLQHDFVKLWELVDGQVSKGRERILGRKAVPYRENPYAEASKLLSQQLLPDGAPYEITVRNSPCEGGVSKLMDHPLEKIWSRFAIFCLKSRFFSM